MKKVFELIKTYKLIFLSIVLYGAAFILKPGVFFYALEMTKGFLIEMVEVMPPVLIISSLITIWVPAEVITKGFGNKSGFKGNILSLLLGSISAGPIYAAFPVAQTLFLKGASIANLVIIISSWAVVKFVMLIVEVNFLGLPFTVTRYVLTIPMIIIMAYIMQKLVKREDIINAIETQEKGTETAKDVLAALPQMNCGACGYKSCAHFAEGVINKETEIEKCKIRNRNKNKPVPAYSEI